MGIPFLAAREAEVVARLGQALGRRQPEWVVTANVDHLRRLSSDEDLRWIIAEATMVVADGTPLVWASRLAGAALPERVAGSHLIWSLSGAAARRGSRLFLLGGEPGAAEPAAAALRARFPGLIVAGTHCPPLGFESSAQAAQAIDRALLSAKPDLVLVGLDFPKQEVLIRRLRALLPHATFVGVGVSFSFVAGLIARAPSWMHGLGLEWLHRLAQEPRRLFPRYVLHGLPFALRLFLWALAQRVLATARPAPA